MAQAGHVLIGTEDQFLDVDAAFCDIMRCDPDSLRGRFVLEVTAPADRPAYVRAIATLRDTERPVELIKRLIRNDGSLVWVRNRASITLDHHRGRTVVGTVLPLAIPVSDDQPATLLSVARFLFASRRERESVCDRMLFSEPGWDAVLAAYVAEAEGLAIDAVTLAGILEQTPATIQRWINALVQHGVLEPEYHSATDKPHAFRLTCDAHRKLEIYLGTVGARHRELAMTS
jgi:PAS domain S-box-containing protein